MEIIELIEQDITYFKNLGFTDLANKFQRDADEIRKLLNKVAEQDNHITEDS